MVTLELTQLQALVVHSILEQVPVREAAHKVAVGEVQGQLEAVLQSQQTPEPSPEETS